MGADSENWTRVASLPMTCSTTELCRRGSRWGILQSRPSLYKSAALASELHRHWLTFCETNRQALLIIQLVTTNSK